MPAGCDFICKNENCSQFKTGFTVNGPWPLGQIELVINSFVVKKNKALREYLIKLKNEDRKLCCIQYPNADRIPTLGYRVSLWSPEAKCVWQYDLELNGRTLQEFLIVNPLPTKCEKTGCELLNFNEVSEKGITCHFCGKKMEQNRWFANEN